MSISTNSISNPRVGELQLATSASRSIGRTQSAIAESGRQISTGRRLVNPSDDPAAAAKSQQVRRAMEAREGYDANLQHADRMLTAADAAVGDALDLVREARQIGLANLGDEASQAERLGAAQVLRALESQLVATANRSEGGVALFGGGQGNGEPYRLVGDGVMYVGGDDARSTAVGSGQSLDFLLNSEDVFGSASRRVGTKPLAADLTGDTQLDHLRGTRGDGVARGSIRISNAGTTEVVDLSQADTVADVIDAINASGTGVTASITGGTSIRLSGANVTVGEVGQATAADLGLLNATPTATLDSPPLERRLAFDTPLSVLNNGAGVGTAGTIELTTGSTSASLSLSGLGTVGELINAVNALPISVEATMSDDGSRLLLRNPVQGAQLAVSDNGGTAAADLGWATFTADDVLADLNGGRGVRLNPGGPDLRVLDAAGNGFDVDLDAAATMTDVVDAINAAAASAGSPATASFDATLPGLRVANVTAVSSAGTGAAAGDLGLDAPADTTNTIEARDVNRVEARGPFSSLRSLINTLEQGDGQGARQAVADLEADEANLASARGEAGARLREVGQRQERLADAQLADQVALSRLEDVDLAAAAVEYQALQNSLQAQLQTVARQMNVSLFDFLR
jgi:flagellar hook-associated protein 3 FlgL